MAGLGCDWSIGAELPNHPQALREEGQDNGTTENLASHVVQAPAFFPLCMIWTLEYSTNYHSTWQHVDSEVHRLCVSARCTAHGRSKVCQGRKGR